ncbi:MAG: SigE family RNA polymerase sigma factor [Actinomycetota bacterium]|nr:SigE family RNA polymerase sigma factor [Actinomycetota bacterium]
MKQPAVRTGSPVAGPSTGGRLAELYLRHADGAIRLAYLLTGDRSLAEDLVQDAFVRLAGRLRHIRDPAAFEAYLRRTVVNLSRMHFRHARVERAYLERQPAAGVEGEPDPDVALREAVRQALLGLPERQRAALVLRFYAGLPDGEIADVLRCRRATVRSLVFRGLEALRGQMGSEGDED